MAVSAITAEAQVKVKPVVGGDFQFRIDTQNEVTSYFYGVNAGALASYETSQLFTVRGGLQYKYSFTNSTVAYYNLQKGDAFMYEHSLEIPATFGVRLDVLKNSKLHIDIGPTGSYVIASKVKTNADLLRYSAGVTYDSYEEEVMKGHWNFFMGGTFSLELGDFGLLGVGYRYGFLNLCYNTRTIYQHGVSLNLMINL